MRFKLMCCVLRCATCREKDCRKQQLTWLVGRQHPSSVGYEQAITAQHPFSLLHA